MRQLLDEYAQTIVADGCGYVARAYGAERPDGRWEAWIEFVAADGPRYRRTRRRHRAAALGNLGVRSRRRVPGRRLRTRAGPPGTARRRLSRVRKP